MAECETVLGDGAAMRDAVQASLWNSVAEESSSVRAEECPRMSAAWPSGRKDTRDAQAPAQHAKSAVAPRFEACKHVSRKP